MKYRVLLSDADNTLFDFDRGERQAIRQTFQSFGIPDTDENSRLYARHNLRQWKRLEAGETTQDRLTVERFETFLQEIDSTADAAAMSVFSERLLMEQRFLMPGAPAFCRQVSAAMPIYLVTNGIARVQHSRFDSSELRPYFTQILISEEVGFAKPDPRMLWQALQLAGVQPQQAVLLGDSVSADIQSARSAGIDSILLTAAPDDTQGATYAVQTLEQAQRLILQDQPAAAGQ